MLIKRNKPKKRILPTEEEFLQFIPTRADLEWTTNNEGFVEIKMPKFNGNFGKSFCHVIKKDENITANMDKLGSLVWKNCDGKKTVKQILVVVKKNFPDAENIDQRLFLYLQQLQGLRYISFK